MRSLGAVGESGREKTGVVLADRYEKTENREMLMSGLKSVQKIYHGGVEPSTQIRLSSL